jgi:hypothetical protein
MRSAAGPAGPEGAASERGSTVRNNGPSDRHHDGIAAAIEPHGLARLGREGIALLRIVPLVHLAWLMHETLGPEDRRVLVEAAGNRGIVPGTAAARLLAEWLDERPSEDFFAACLLELKTLLADLPASEQAGSKSDLVAYMMMLDRLAIDSTSRRVIVGVSRRRGGRHARAGSVLPAEHVQRGRERLG